MLYVGINKAFCELSWHYNITHGISPVARGIRCVSLVSGAAAAVVVVIVVEL